MKLEQEPTPIYSRRAHGEEPNFISNSAATQFGGGIYEREGFMLFTSPGSRAPVGLGALTRVVIWVRTG
jgi:hypothetical protein